MAGMMEPTHEARPANRFRTLRSMSFVRMSSAKSLARFATLSLLIVADTWLTRPSVYTNSRRAPIQSTAEP
eukprot:10745054-Heterocapsa_arctica.AAC.1